MSRAIRGARDPPFKIFLSVESASRVANLAEIFTESDASEWDEDSSRDKSPVMSRSIVLVTYQGTTTTAIVKYREFDPVARSFSAVN